MKKGVVVKPIITSGMNRRCQVDFIDMQSNPNGEYLYKWSTSKQTRVYWCNTSYKAKSERTYK